MAKQTDHEQLLQIDETSRRVDRILDDVLNAARRGQPLVLDEYYLRYPELAEELRELLPTMLLMECPQTPLTARKSAFGNGLLSVARVAPPVLNDFAIVSEIGRGAMGVVYEAIQLALKRRVALKVLYPTVRPNEKYLRRFLREAEIAARLHNTNIVPVYEAGESEGCFYYAMQLIEGSNLQRLIETSGSGFDDQHSRPTIQSLMSHAETMPQSDRGQSRDEFQGGVSAGTTLSTGLIHSTEACAKIILQVADGLHYAHQRGILHRDIKPSNIIIDPENRAWIADFGLAMADDDTALTDTGDVVGTIRYLSPERFQGQCDHRSDVYALGVTLYEALHCRPFWSAAGRAQLVQQILSGRYSSSGSRPYNCPGDLRRIVEKATQQEPTQRYQTADQLAEDLRRFLDGRPILARQLSVFRRGYLWARRNPVVSSLTILLLLLATGSAIVTGSLTYRASSLRAESLRNFQEAKRNLGFLLETVDKVCLCLGQDQRLNRPEFQDLRHQLLRMVIEFNHQFDGVPEIEMEMRFLTAQANVRLGSLTSGDDTLTESAGYLDTARTVLVKLHESAPTRVDIGLELARCLREFAMVEWKMGLRESAFERNVLAIELSQSFKGAEELEGEIQVELARTRLVMGDFLTDFGSRDEAEGYYLQAIDSLERLNARYPHDRNNLTELGQAHARLGHCYLANLRFWRKAETPLGRAAELYELAEALQPGNPDLAAKRAQVLKQQAKFLFVGGQRVDAVNQLELARPLLADLVQKHTSVAQYRSQYAFHLKQMVVYRSTLDRKDPEITSCIQTAVKEFTWLIAHDPLNLSYKVGLIEIQMSHAEQLSFQDQWQPALDALGMAMSMLDELRFVESMDKLIRDHRYYILCKRAELQANLDRFDESLTDWDQAIMLATGGFRGVHQIQRLRTVVLSGDLTRGIAELDMLLEKLSETTNGRQHFLSEAARVLAISHRLLTQRASSDEDLELAEEYAKRATEMLRELVEINMFNLNFTESTKDYSSLRSRTDFQEIVQAARQKSLSP